MARWICTSKNTCRLKRTMVELTDDEVRFAGFACASCKSPLERVKPADLGKYGEVPLTAAPKASRVPTSPITLRLTLADDDQPTLRDLFAMFAFAKTTDGSHIARARSAYGIADAMMRERKAKDFGNGDMDDAAPSAEREILNPTKSGWHVRKAGRIVRCPDVGHVLLNGHHPWNGAEIKEGDQIVWVYPLPENAENIDLSVEIEFT